MLAKPPTASSTRTRLGAPKMTSTTVRTLPSAFPPNKNPLPRSLDELHRLVCQKSPKCLCPVCDTEYYTALWGNPLFKKYKINRFVHTRNEYGNKVCAPLQLVPWAHEAMDLAHAAIGYFDRPKEFLNNIQLNGLSGLMQWIEHRKDDILVQKPQHQIYWDLVTAYEVCMLQRSINELFFCQQLSELPIGWDHSLPPQTCGQTANLPSPNGETISIGLNPQTSQRDASLMLHFLGTLLHEICHVFLMSYGREPVERDLGAGHHGNSWQTIAAAVERVFLSLTGLPVLLGRFAEVQNHWHCLYPLPSEHNLSVWNLHDEFRVAAYQKYLVQVYIACKYKTEFSLIGCYERWRYDYMQYYRQREKPRKQHLAINTFARTHKPQATVEVKGIARNRRSFDGMSKSISTAQRGHTSTAKFLLLAYEARRKLAKRCMRRKNPQRGRVQERDEGNKPSGPRCLGSVVDFEGHDCCQFAV